MADDLAVDAKDGSTTGSATVAPSFAAVFGVPRKGIVVAYDPARGLGSIGVEPQDGAPGDGAPGDGAPLYGFHCTAIAGGSRDIAVGTPVIFVLFPGLGGTLEAGSIIGLPGDDPG